MNNCSFVGRVGRDAVVRNTSGDNPVTGWSLAVDSGYGERKQTVWLDCSMWGTRGPKIAEYITKGSRLGVHGEIGTREHEGKTYVTLNVRDVTLLGEKKDAKPSQDKQSSPADAGGFEDPIPF